MRTVTGPQGPGTDLSRLKAVALIARHSVLAVALCAMLIAPGVSAEAQQPKKIPRIGYLTLGSSSPPSPLQEAFRDGLRQLGYVEGQNIQVEYRYAAGKAERLDALAAELVGLKLDVVVAADMPSIDAPRSAR